MARKFEIGPEMKNYIKSREGQRACIDNRFGFRENFNWVDDRRIAVNKKKLSNFSAMKNRVAS
jgi:hypothetical protein